jgi:hypothetical protein
MGAVTFQGYYTGTYIQERGIFVVNAWHPGPVTLQFFGDALSPTDALDVPAGAYYYGSADPAGLSSILTSLSPFSAPTILYSNDPTLTIHPEITVDQITFTCLLAGTIVATPSGERLVENLVPGDLVLTPEGESVAIRWIGRQSALAMFSGLEAMPVLIRAGALGDGMPSSDLCVSQNHAILVDDILANARALVNGSTIVVMPDPPERIDYFHLELDRHRLIVANGTPVESFIDDVSREEFDNVEEWKALGLEPLPAEALSYVKAKSARQLPEAIRQRLADRAAAGSEQLAPV